MQRKILNVPMSVALAVAVATLGPGAAVAQSYPTKPIRLIVPFAPSGGTDLLGRTIAQKLGDAFGHVVIVDNRAGGSGNTGTDMVAKSNPDGYTLLMGYVGNLAINPFLFKNLPYDPVKDFSPITLAATAPNVLVAHPSVAANSVKEALKGSDTAAIKAASEKLNEVWQAVSTELYKNAGDKSKESSATADTSTTNTGASGSGKDEGPIIDAEVVDEKKK